MNGTGGGGGEEEQFFYRFRRGVLNLGVPL
jgi:hypothetical protein